MNLADIPAVAAKPPAALDPDSIEYKIGVAKAAIGRLLRAGHPLVVSFSAGKDSSCTLSLALTAAADLCAEGYKVPPMVLMHEVEIYGATACDMGAVES